MVYEVGGYLVFEDLLERVVEYLSPEFFGQFAESTFGRSLSHLFSDVRYDWNEMGWDEMEVLC